MIESNATANSSAIEFITGMMRNSGLGHKIIVRVPRIRPEEKAKVKNK